MDSKSNDKLNIRHVPYNTGKIKIGEYYLPPQKNYMDNTAVHWQNVLTGVYQERRKQRVQSMLYVAGLVIIFIVLGVM